jgi:bifunctional ADP-heptose synthase (sugar kinase/adenylyltransferase)
LIQALDRLPGADRRYLVQSDRRRTPTYTKPMLHQAGQLARELNRLDIKNRTPLPADLEQRLLNGLAAAWASLDALIILDQVSEADCGVITGRMREWLRESGERDPRRFVLADSRERIGEFRAVCLKPNQRECLRAVLGDAAGLVDLQAAAATLARQTGRAVFCTQGEAGMLLVQPAVDGELFYRLPAYPVHGPIDTVGAGDSTSAALAAAVAAGASLDEAAAFGNLIASITIQQLGTTGTANPDQIRQRWREVD